VLRPPNSPALLNPEATLRARQAGPTHSSTTLWPRVGTCVEVERRLGSGRDNPGLSLHSADAERLLWCGLNAYNKARFHFDLAHTSAAVRGDRTALPSGTGPAPSPRALDPSGAPLEKPQP